MGKTKYFGGGLKSESHTPVYKMHKYFARRPHNLFRALIEQYSKPGDVVFDPFGGGGPTVIEGLTAGRRVVSFDVNPLASFVQHAQALPVSTDSYIRLAAEVQDLATSRLDGFYTTECRRCSADAHARWYERAYTVSCPACASVTTLENDNKTQLANGRVKNGSYRCVHCAQDFVAASVPRTGSVLLNVRYRCASCDAHETAEVDSRDVALASKPFDHPLIPDDEIPLDWDRQKEDGLYNKGFVRFSDLFTPRNAFATATYFEVLDSLDASPPVREMMTFTLSALIRYTNNMTFSTAGWMDGRPVAWAKHAYWTPAQFVECNPLEYFQHRVSAVRQGLVDQQSRFREARGAATVRSFVRGSFSHVVVNASSHWTGLPENSVDFVLTDPPYGSNVQYGELCEMWLVWLRDRLPFTSVSGLSDEIVVHRKAGPTAKTFDDYTAGLSDVFSECERVLKPGGIMAFTFNNRDANAWLSVMEAVAQAGFVLDPAGITYQDEIHAYRDTAHNRFEGTAQGDFVYSFRKPEPREKRKTRTVSWRRAIRKLDPHESPELVYLSFLRQVLPATIDQMYNGTLSKVGWRVFDREYIEHLIAAEVETISA